jgi:RNA polymerase-binding protein DksA
VEAQELKTWRDRLLEERGQLERELGALRQSTSATAQESSGDLSNHSSHMADLGTDTMEREKAFLFVSQKRRRLDEIDIALQRIEAGSFGGCEVCGQPIPQRRLERLPSASMCVPCKELHEKQEKKQRI